MLSNPLNSWALLAVSVACASPISQWPYRSYTYIRYLVGCGSVDEFEIWAKGEKCYVIHTEWMFLEILLAQLNIPLTSWLLSKCEH